MNKQLLSQLQVITAEEQLLLDGHTDVEKNLYSSTRDFVIDSKKMLERGKLIDMRPHTRFVHFPKHRHNYIEIIYMCTGSTTHIINDTFKVTLKPGEILFLNQYAYQEIEPAATNDIAVNFIILPEFFDRTFSMIDEENVLRDFLVGTLRQKKGISDYLHFQASDILPIQNLIENMIWSIIHKQTNRRSINQTTMGLLFLQLLNYTDKISNTPQQYEQSLVFSVLKYIEENYKDASLFEISEVNNLPVYQLSKIIKSVSGHTFKELLQTKRLSHAVFLLTSTALAIEDIIAAVGYDNTSYFHRIFKNKYGMTPKNYRNCN